MGFRFTILCLVLFACISCNSEKNNKTELAVVTKQDNSTTTNNKFNDYWYTGKAELNSYELKQARYNEIRDGEVVLIFVTEPFSLSKQVKLDRPDKAGKDKVTVMKLNQVRKFNTGIYDYSIVTSTFTPVDTQNHPLTLKSTTSIQEWCGQTFTQLNLDQKKYNFQQFTYFESTGDEKKQFDAALLEEDLMTRIRINNGQLPLGEIDLIPSTLYSRSSHKNLQPEKAKISKTENKKSITYKIEYSTLNRTITIESEKNFPFKILGWIEDNGSDLITTARLKSSINEPYWKQKSVKDEAKRKELMLSK
ncbi:hypothetical protein SAMN04488096_10135 [Mesonia phycicola]|uniref:Septum formation inhibitor Maf n=1 Tax=Mesonia phycicola TaxID=579105 RepID=A0A1M6A2R2_9FLAO|nr:hypothetical protein [Mesonia phycicola]SHI30762.1 hypothetical protein SAMN04488096_10135 [Mesonia phycicola]